MTISAKPTPRGRPGLDPEERKSDMIRLRVTKAEKQSYTERGGDTWLRRLLATKPRRSKP